MRRNILAALALALLLVCTATACTPEPIDSIPSASQFPGEPPLTVGIPEVPDGVNPQEGALLAHAYAAALNAAGVKAVVADAPVKKGALVSSVESGSVDIVPAYSRLALTEAAPTATATGASDVIDDLKKALPAGVVLLEPAKAEERDALVVTAVTAEKYQLKSLSDLAKVCGKLAMGGTAEFKTKARGLPGLGGDYNCVPKKYVPLQATPDVSDESIWWSLLRDNIQLADMQNSSPAIEDNSLVVLDDPKNLFLSQNVVPLVAEAAVPDEVQTVLNKVSAALSTEQLSNLNRLSRDRHYGDMSEVATAWLVQQGLIKASS
ncbi:glycine betaine ABC transporter substrate-binding protein [Specibacter sp. AOP5-B1-6]|uniref:glycine betaine ABC transporter substrate-binding protein n=1 Tax=Specibacter sp. AOP5-B1-6 TaxID=3457653 RepID=UPI00402BCE3B